MRVRRCAFGLALALLLAAAASARADYLYVAGAGNTIERISPSGVVSPLYTVQSTSNGVSARGLATDGMGNLYPLETGQVLKLGGGQAGIFSNVDGFNAAIAADYSGNIYLNNVNNLAITMYSPKGMDRDVAMIRASSIAADSEGDVYAAGQNEVFKISPGGTISPFVAANANGLGQELGVDAAGNLYIVNQLTSIVASPYSLLKATPGGSLTTLISGLNDVGSVAADAAGNVFVNAAYIDPSGQTVNAIGAVRNGTFLPIAEGPDVAGYIAASPIPVTVPEPSFVSIILLAGLCLGRARCIDLVDGELPPQN